MPKSEAAWANHKYHGHCTLPLDMALKLKAEQREKYGTPHLDSPWVSPGLAQGQRTK